MRIKKLAFLAILTTIFLLHSAYSKTDSVYVSRPSSRGEGFNGRVEDIYELNIELSAAQSNVSAYIPKYRETEWHTAKMYAGFFGMEREAAETEDYYSFKSGRAVIYIYKHISLLRYEINPEYYFESGSPLIITDTDAINHASSFLDGNFLYTNYEETEVVQNDGIFTVTFVSGLGGLKNYAFPNQITLDKFGNVLSLNYYFIDYEKIGNAKTRSMREAFHMLPTDFDAGVKITIDSCRLIYIYKNSIVQPAYHFSGTFQKSAAFERFIEASSY